MRQFFAPFILLGFFLFQVDTDHTLSGMIPPTVAEKQDRFLIRQLRTKVAELTFAYMNIELNLTQEITRGKNRTIEKKKDMLKILAKKYNASEGHLSEKEEHCIHESGYKLFLEENFDGNNTLSPFWSRIQECSDHFIGNFTSVHRKTLQTVQSEVEMEPNLLRAGILDSIETLKIVRMKGELYFQKARECIEKVANEFGPSVREKKRLFLRCLKMANKSSKPDD